MNEQIPEHCERVSARAVAKSGRVLFAFSQFYLPFYEIDERYLFSRYDLFAWLSAFVYDVDEEIEAGLPVETAVVRLDRLAAYIGRSIILDPPLVQAFRDARSYYEFEHRVTKSSGQYSFEEIEHAASARSFDFRMMHRVLAQSLKLPYRENLFSWFRAFELRMEIEDDLLSIEEDRQRQTFNIFCLSSLIDARKGRSFVTHLYSKVEEEISVRTDSLSLADRVIAEQVSIRYREIVPRPDLALSAPSAD